MKKALKAFFSGFFDEDDPIFGTCDHKWDPWSEVAEAKELLPSDYTVSLCNWPISIEKTEINGFIHFIYTYHIQWTQCSKCRLRQRQEVTLTEPEE